MANKKIVLILLVLVLLPALFYTLYEISSYSENEQVLTQIYDQKLNSILYSINQYYWDRSNKIKSDFLAETKGTKKNKDERFQAFMERTVGLEAIFTSDSLLEYFTISFRPESDLSQHKWTLTEELKSKEQLFNRLYYRHQVGYTKIEPLIYELNKDQKYLVLMFITESNSPHYEVAGLFFDLHRFAETLLQEKLADFAEEDVIVGIFTTDMDTALIRTAEISFEDARLTKKLWLFPNHQIGIRTQQGTSIAEQVSNRFKRSLILIFLLDVVLIISAWFLYKAVRREMELARMKSDFVSNVSHELRTPLALIRMFAETLELGRVKDPQKKTEYYRIIGQESVRLTHLINNILDFSKMEAEKKQFNFADEELNEIVTSCLDFYKFHIENNGFTLKLEQAPVPLPVLADKEALSEALINLLDNAMKYSEKEKRIFVRTGTEGKLIFMEVEDKGIGISEEHKKHIFEKFYRVSAGLVHNTKGSGLGLTLVDYAVQAHKGNISVNSKPGQGSCFRMTFPKRENA